MLRWPVCLQSWRVQDAVAAMIRAPLFLACSVAMVFGQPAPGQESLAGIADEAVRSVPACAGLAVGVEQRSARIQRFYGEAGNRSRITADTEFEIGSITKTFTATLLADEDRRGTMHITDPLARFAPPGMRVPSFDGQQILLLHLADHTSGLPRGVPDFSPPLMPQAMWQFVSSYVLQRPPGAQFLYSNLGYGLLARAIARRESSTEDALFARIITGPLGMRDTAIALSPAQHARLAQGYRADGQPAAEGAPGFPALAGAGALHSTLNDMMRYLDFQLGRLDTPLNALLPVLYQPRHADGPNSSVGLGWHSHEQAQGLTMIYKGGTTRGYESYIFLTPATASGTVILSNQARCPVGSIGAQIMRMVNGSGLSLPEPTPSGDEN